jgi:hypothetical protein
VLLGLILGILMLKCIGTRKSPLGKLFLCDPILFYNKIELLYINEVKIINLSPINILIFVNRNRFNYLKNE